MYIRATVGSLEAKRVCDREFNFDRFPREYRHRVYTPDASNLVLEFLFSSLFGEGKGRRIWPCILARPIHDEDAINESDTGSYKPPLFVKGEGVDFGKADNEACSTTAPNNFSPFFFFVILEQRYVTDFD